MTKTTTHSAFPDCVLWRAHDAYHSLAGILVTEPGNLDALIAFVFIDQEKKNEALTEAAQLIADDPNRLDDAVDSTGGFCRVDLRDRGRADSKRAMPGWVYGMSVIPNVPEMTGEYFKLNPYCPIRLAMMLAKKPA